MIDVLAVVEERSRLGNALRGPRFSTFTSGRSRPPFSTSTSDSYSLHCDLIIHSRPLLVAHYQDTHKSLTELNTPSHRCRRRQRRARPT